MVSHSSSFLKWCRRGDLNPHGDRPPPPQDGVSTNSTTSASLNRVSSLPTSSALEEEPEVEQGYFAIQQEHWIRVSLLKWPKLSEWMKRSKGAR